jgi:hypothetical protein
MFGSCGTHRREGLGKKILFGKLTFKLEENFKMGHIEKRWNGVDWIDVGQVRDDL